MDLGNGLGHLTYSTLVHPGDTGRRCGTACHLRARRQAQRRARPAAGACPCDCPAPRSPTLTGDPAERKAFLEYLASQDLYVYTVNAFPYGPFKGREVMEQVYEPDWTTEEPHPVHDGVADVLVDITDPASNRPSRPLPWRSGPTCPAPDYVAAFTHQPAPRRRPPDRRWRRAPGRRVKLALEPEPFCFLETTDETVAYFENHVYSARRVAAARAARPACPSPRSIRLVRRHLGVVFDIGHQSVGFEDIPPSLELLVAAGIPIFKLQEAAALWVQEVTADGRARARAVHRHHLPEPDDRAPRRRGHQLPESRRRAGGVASRPRRRPRVPDALPRAGLPRRDRRVPHDQVRHRGRAADARARPRSPTTWRSRRTPGTSCRPT